MYAYLDTDKNREMSLLLWEKEILSESGKTWFTHPESNSFFIESNNYSSDDGLVQWLCPAYTFEDIIQNNTVTKVWGVIGGIVLMNLLHLYQTDQDWQQEVINTLKKLKK